MAYFTAPPFPLHMTSSNPLRRAIDWALSVLKSMGFWIRMGALAIGLLVLGLLFDAVVMPSFTRQGDSEQVPDVRDVSFDEAYERLEGLGLEPERRAQPFNPTLPRDIVVDQDPVGGATVKSGRTVLLFVNTSPDEEVAVPDVRTLAEGRARTMIRDAGLRVGEVATDSVYSPYKGTIARQRPEPGRSVRQGSEVRLWRSPGLSSATTIVPDVKGLRPDDAQRTARAAGMWIDPTQELEGRVMRQEPNAGASASRGTELRLYTEE